MPEKTLKDRILEAAQSNDDALDDLLQKAAETMNEKEFDHLCDMVHQIMSESLRELKNWNIRK